MSRRTPLEVRFWAKVNKTETCWLWTAYRDRYGYGATNDENHVTVLAHRLAYQLVVGPIPPGLTLDHLCRVRHCVNPSHLEPVTRWENNARGIGTSAQNMRRTHCVRGHLLPPWTRPKQKRQCKECERIRSRARTLRKRSASSP